MFAEIDLSIWGYAIAFGVVFLAQIYGAFASGDGLIIQPIFIALGLPANVAMANDTTGSMFAGFSAAWVYHKNNLMPYKAMLWWMPGILIGPVIGAFFLASLPLFILEIFIIASAIFGALYFLLNRNKETISEDAYRNHYAHKKPLSLISGFIVGFLTGLGLGGVGIITRLLLVMCGLDIKRAIAAAQIVGTIPIFPALAAYLMAGLIAPLLLLVISIAFASGAYVGGHIIVKMDAKLLQKIFMILTIMIAILTLILKFF